MIDDLVNLQREVIDPELGEMQAVANVHGAIHAASVVLAGADEEVISDAVASMFKGGLG